MTRLSPETTVTAIAADLPGAAELFRRKGINFCCGGNIALSEAATRAGVLPDALLADLQALADAAGRDAPEPTPALIDHILSRYHETHRAELEWLIPFAQMRHEHDDTARLLAGVEHAAHGLRLPEGACGSWTALYTGLRKFSEDLVTHMHLENNVLFARFEPAHA